MVKRSSVIAAATLVTLALASGNLVGDSRAGPSAKRVETFKGSCEVVGRVMFTPPLGIEEQETRAVANGTAACDGTLLVRGRTRELDDSRVGYHVVAHGAQSCASAPGGRGRGYLQFKRRKLRFRFYEERIGTSSEVRLEGRVSGSFAGTATATGDPAKILQSCMGEGLSRAGFEIRGETAPKISG